jgi:hypothetical protein
MSMNAEYNLILNTDKFTAGADRALNAMEKIKGKSQQAEFSIKKMGTAILGVGVSAVGIYTSLSNLDRAQLSIAKSALAVEKTEKRLNDLRKNGKQNTNEYRIAQQQLANQQEQLRLKEDQLRDTQILLATSMISTGVHSAQLLSNAFKGLSLSAIQARVLGLIPLRTAALTTSPAIAGILPAAGAATLGLRGLTAAAWGFVATPLGIALLAIAGAFAVWESNLGGLRGAFEGLTGKNLSVVNGLNQLTETMFSGKSAAEMAKKSTEEQTQSLIVYDNELGSATESTTAFSGSISELGGSVDSSSNKIGAFGESVKSYVKDLEFGTKAIHDILLTVDATLRTNPYEQLLKSEKDLIGFMTKFDVSTKENRRNFNLMKDDMISGLKAIGEGFTAADGEQGARKFRDTLIELRRQSKLTREEFNELNSSISSAFYNIKDTPKKNEKDKDRLDREETRELAREWRAATEIINRDRNIQGVSSLLGIATDITRGIDNMFAAIRASGVLSLSRQLHGNLAHLGGITQARTHQLLNSSLNIANLTAGGANALDSNGMTQAGRLSAAGSGRGFGARSVSRGGSRSKGRSSKHGGSNVNDQRLYNLRVLKALQGLKMGSLSKLTGISISKAPMFAVGRGWSMRTPGSDRAINEMFANISKAHKIRNKNRTSALEEIRRFENLFGFDMFDENEMVAIMESQFGGGDFREFAKNFIDTQLKPQLQIKHAGAFFSKFQTELKLDEEGIYNFLNSAEGQRDLDNMLSYKNMAKYVAVQT